MAALTWPMSSVTSSQSLSSTESEAGKAATAVGAGRGAFDCSKVRERLRKSVPPHSIVIPSIQRECGLQCQASSCCSDSSSVASTAFYEPALRLLDMSEVARSTSYQLLYEKLKGQFFSVVNQPKKSIDSSALLRIIKENIHFAKENSLLRPLILVAMENVETLPKAQLLFLLKNNLLNVRIHVRDDYDTLLFIFV